jgi:hypothetical protein
MNKTYKIEEEGTDGWELIDPKYQHLTKERCSELLEHLIEKGVNPNYLRAVRDDLPTSD